MHHKKKIATICVFILFVVLAVAATKPTRQKERNLKVLPKDISDEKLDSIMNTFNYALGVKCDFCHVKSKIFGGGLEYASDAEPMKENARQMMQMVIYINKTYFLFDSITKPEYLNTVTCKTCHRGQPLPPVH